jgi:hypothetical protein
MNVEVGGREFCEQSSSNWLYFSKAKMYPKVRYLSGPKFGPPEQEAEEPNI